MNYRRLGKTELMVSEIGFGGEYLEWEQKVDFDRCKRIFEACEEGGINIFDCWMPNPEVRSAIGEAIKGKRDKWIIQGHIGSTWQNGQYVRTREINIVKQAFEDMLSRFDTNYIDLGMIHFVDSEEEWDSLQNSPFMDYVNELKATGKIKHVGMSSHNPGVAKKAVMSGKIEMLMFSVNPAFDLMPANENYEELFDKDKYANEFLGINPDRAELYALCEQYDVGITVMKPFAGGRLFTADSHFGVPLTATQCIHYALTRPGVCSVMGGYSTVEHVKDAVSYETATEDEKNYMEVLANAPKHAYGKKCMYCNHCKPCPANIDIAAVNKYYDLAVMQNTVPATLKEHYLALGATASDCIACGQCETRCPFKVNVVERMAKARELFK